MKNEKVKSNIANPNRESLTPEKLKTFKGYENLSDSEAEELTASIKIFALLLYQVANIEVQDTNNNQLKQAA